MAIININPDAFKDDQYPRNLARIALEIKSTWKNPTWGAVLYLNAMLHIHSPKPDASYYNEDARTLVGHFLANAKKTWRGRTARRIKEELKQQYNIK